MADVDFLSFAEWDLDNAYPAAAAKESKKSAKKLEKLVQETVKLQGTTWLSCMAQIKCPYA